MKTPELITLIVMMILMFSRFLLPEKLFSHRLVSRFIIPLGMILSWIVLMFYQSFIVEHVFTILTDTYSIQNLTTKPLKEIVTGQPVTGKFTAKDNYLGIVGIRFWNFYRLNSDRLSFRLKSEGSDKWYYENIYNTDQFQPHQYFTFGFPAIPDSQGRKYEFQIESLEGTSGNAVGISPVEPAVITKYKYPRSLVTSSPVSFLRFCLMKIHNLVKNSTFTASSYVHLLPFLLYLIYLTRLHAVFLKRISYFQKYITKKNSALVLTLLGLLSDVLFIKIGTLTIWALLGILGYVIATYKLKSIFLFCLGIGMLLLSCVLLYLAIPVPSERAGAWAWIFLFIWLASQIWTLKPARN